MRVVFAVVAMVTAYDDVPLGDVAEDAARIAADEAELTAGVVASWSVVHPRDMVGALTVEQASELAQDAAMTRWRDLSEIRG